MIRVLAYPGPLTPGELLKCSPREAAMIEALRAMFERIKPNLTEDNGAMYTLADDFNEALCAAQGAYLRIRAALKEEDA